MAKISSLGNSGMGQIPPGWDHMATQRTLFEPWPNAPGTDVGKLEPYGNPAYEGYGYPAAGYGQTRRKVVGLAVPKAVNPQLIGWEDPQPRGLKITPRGSINEDSDKFTRSQVAALQGLGRLGQAQQKNLMSDELPTPQIVEERRAAAWRIIAEMDRLHGVVKAAKPGTFVTGVRTWAGLDAPATALNRLVRDYYTVLRPNLIGAEGKFEKLDAVVKKPNRNWQAWMDAANSLSKEFNSAMGDVQTYTLKNLLIEGTSTTLFQIGGGVKEFGERSLTLLDWLTKPWVLGGLLVGAGAIYIFARSGGALVRMDAPKERLP